MPFETLPIDLGKWEATWAEMVALGFAYVWDGKPDPLKASPPVFKNFTKNPPLPVRGGDCSGCMRYAVWHATFGKVDIGDGSFDQGEKLRAMGLKVTDPANCALEDGHLRINVHHPDHMDGTGHIWAVRNRVTSESYGGHGPGHRAWDARLSSGHTLSQLATLCFVAT